MFETKVNFEKAVLSSNDLNSFDSSFAEVSLHLNVDLHVADVAEETEKELP